MIPMLCGEEAPYFLIFDFSTAPPLLFYSYIPAVAISLFLGIYVFLRGRGSLLNKSLFYLTLLFSAWVLNIIVQWVSSYNDALMFSWQLTALFELLIYVVAVYFMLAYLDKGRGGISTRSRLALYLIYLPAVVLLPTAYNVETYDIVNCEGVVGELWAYIYYAEPALILAIIFILFNKVKTISDKKERINFLLTGLGIFLFLTFFWLSNLLGEVAKIYQINFFGALGMMVFLGFLAYLIVRFKAFNLKLIGSNVLVFSLWVITAALLLIDDVALLHIIVAITLVLTIILGVFLIRGVRKEVAQREQIEKLLGELGKSNDKLWVANEKLKDLDKQKTEFVSIASHQLRSPLTAIKGYSSMVLEGSFGEISDKVREAVDRVFQSSQRLVLVIEDFLNISRIELGTMKYEWSDFDLREVVETVVRESRHTVEKNGLKLFFEYDTNLKYVVHGDSGKLSQVVSNMIDNAMKYTKQGSIKVKLEKLVGKVRFSVQDTGIGINTETMPKLFEKFSRASDAGKTNIAGTGLGLYVAKEIVTAHKGKIWAESEGVGLGSTFIVEI